MGTVKLKSWYDQVYWSDTRSRSYQTYIPYIEHLAVKPGHSLLDVGCGGGRLLKAAQENRLVAFGVDLSFNGAAMALSFAPSTYVAVANGQQLPFPNNTFDYLTCLGSLEHFLDIEGSLAEIIRVCKPAAGICIMIPNSFYLFDIISVVKTGYSRKGTFQPQEELATRGEWQDLFESHGLNILKIFRDREPIDTTWRNVFSDLNPIRIFNRIVEKILQIVMPLNLGYQFIFVCQKAK